MSLSHVSRHPYCGVSCLCSSCFSLTQVGWLSITLSWPSDSLLRYMHSQYTALAASNSPRATNLNLTPQAPCPSPLSLLLSAPPMPRWWSSASLPPSVISLWTSSSASRSSPPLGQSWPGEGSGCRSWGRGASVWRDGGREKWLWKYWKKLETHQNKIW